MRTWVGAAVLSASLVATGAARADPIRILVAASHSRGAPGELPLLHAAEDVEHVEGVLTTLGDVRPADVITLVDPTPAALDAAIDRAGALAATHAPQDVTFLFYFSGHGDRDRIHLGGETVAMADLTTRVRAVPAALRMLVTDACRNYPTRSKGVATEPGFAIDSAVDHPADGVIWLFSAGEGEPALESDELRGGLFTYYWVNGLRGAADANGDGRVTLAESYDFAYSQTLFRSAHGSGVLQHPSAVFDLHQAAPIVLTSTAGSTALLRFPQAADSRYLVYAVGSRAVLGELWGSAERSVAFALPPGRYLVQRMGGAGSAGVDLALSAGESRALSTAEFRAVPEEQLAAKGGTVVLRPHELGVDVEGAASRLSTFGEQILATVRLPLGLVGALVRARGRARHPAHERRERDARVGRRGRGDRAAMGVRPARLWPRRGRAGRCNPAETSNAPGRGARCGWPATPRLSSSRGWPSASVAPRASSRGDRSHRVVRAHGARWRPLSPGRERRGRALDGQRRAGHRPAILTASVLEASSGLLFGSSDSRPFSLGVAFATRGVLAGIY